MLISEPRHCQHVTVQFLLGGPATFARDNATLNINVYNNNNNNNNSYSAYKSKESGASVAKEMCFQRSSERIEGKSRLPQSGWKIVPQSRTSGLVVQSCLSELLLYWYKLFYIAFYIME